MLQYKGGLKCKKNENKKKWTKDTLFHSGLSFCMWIHWTGVSTNKYWILAKPLCLVCLYQNPTVEFIKLGLFLGNISAGLSQILGQEKSPKIPRCLKPLGPRPSGEMESEGSVFSKNFFTPCLRKIAWPQPPVIPTTRSFSPLKFSLPGSPFCLWLHVLPLVSHLTKPPYKTQTLFCSLGSFSFLGDSPAFGTGIKVCLSPLAGLFESCSLLKPHNNYFWFSRTL